MWVRSNDDHLKRRGDLVSYVERTLGNLRLPNKSHFSKDELQEFVLEQAKKAREASQNMPPADYALYEEYVGLEKKYKDAEKVYVGTNQERR